MHALLLSRNVTKFGGFYGYCIFSAYFFKACGPAQVGRMYIFSSAINEQKNTIELL